MSVLFKDSNLKGFIRESEFTAIRPLLDAARRQLEEKNGLGNDFLGWMELPGIRDKEEYARIKAAAKKIMSDSQVLVVIGIGGSYLGARSAIEFLTSPNYNLLCKDTPQIFFAGKSISATELEEIVSLCAGKDVSVNVISKSGTTTEPAIAFRVFKKWMEDKYGKEGARGRIYVTTDKERGALKKLADEEGYETFVVPDDVGGRYSVLTPVGLLPIACAGIDIDEIMRGAQSAAEEYADPNLETNNCYKYACARNLLYKRGKTTEIFVSYEPTAQYFAEWWKQLYGESEGKDGKGIYPSSVVFSSDLHSMGQYIQDGLRNIFETVLKINKSKSAIAVPADPGSADGLAFLEGKTVDYVNGKALLGTLLAHNDGGVPNIVIEIPEISPFVYGELVYFFEMACAISGYINGVNPFDQPGVESYKKNMFALLGKPGYEDMTAALEARL